MAGRTKRAVAAKGRPAPKGDADRDGVRHEPAGIAPGQTVPDENTTAAIAYDALEDHLGYLMRRAQLWIFQDFIRSLAPIDVRPAQFSVLVVIGANPGLPQITLAQALGIERARLVRLLDQLEARGLVERRPAPSDRRSHALHLTPRGETLLIEAKSLAREHETNLSEKLGGEEPRQTLIRVLALFGKS